ncbi:MAG: carboxypeptidase-like regulatory domain-containing protein [Archangium sp.]|nr:carboxypeptidase-like regulatory domain-containing protein [Archangium sp.]
MRRLWVVLAVVVVALTTGGLVWWLMNEPELSGPDMPPPEDPSGQLDRPFVHVQTDEEAFDAGVGRVAGRVVDANGTPVSGARVRLYAGGPEIEDLECGVCHLAVLDCEDHSTIRRVIQGVRDGTLRAAAPIAEVLTDAEGRFVFEDAPLGGEVVALSGQFSAEASCDSEAVELILEPALVQDVHVADFEGKLVAGARVTLYSPRDGTLVEKRVDAEGRVTLESVDHHAWYFAEAEGALPAAQRLENGGEVVLAAPRTLIIHTLMGGQPVDAEVDIFMHGEARKLRTRDGVLQLDQLSFGYYTVGVSSDALAAAEQSVELVKPITEVHFELRRGAKLLVTVVSASGEPLEQVNGSLSGNDGNASAEAEQGALLILGPVPEGEYALSVTSEGMVAVDKPVDLKPGETTIEVTMRPAPKLSGLVLDGDGKPVAMARVGAWESEQEIALDLTDDDGKFEIELHYSGTFLVRAEEQRQGVAEATVQVPGPPVSLRLAAKGVLEVEVFDADGKPLPSDVMVRSEKDQSVKWVDDEEGRPGRLAGLAAGSYVVEKTIPDRLPLSQKVEITDGRVTKVTLRADPGATISGKVVDHLGKAVEQAMVTVTGRAETVVTNAEGGFEWKGVAPGAAELYALAQNGAESGHAKVTAPATEVVLTIPKVARVTGRVVDERGVVVRAFEANGELVKADDGRFDVPAPNHTLDVWVEGHSAVFLTTAEGDVGDVVVKKEPVVEGDVLDGEGKPVSGATVMGSVDLTPATTDASGRFKLNVTSEDPQELVATRGAMSGRTPLRVGSIAHLVMQRGTAVSGKVVDPTGRAVPTLVTATSRVTQRPIEIDTDEKGRFQLDLPQGVWLFSTRFNRVQRAIDVRGERMEVTLGEEAGACGLSLHSSKPIDAIWLLTVPMENYEGPWDLVGQAAGSVEVPVTTAALEINARGLPCGRYTLAASIENVVTSAPLELRSAAQRVQLEPRVEEQEEVQEVSP